MLSSLIFGVIGVVGGFIGSGICAGIVGGFILAFYDERQKQQARMYTTQFSSEFRKLTTDELDKLTAEKFDPNTFKRLEKLIKQGANPNSIELVDDPNHNYMPALQILIDKNVTIECLKSFLDLPKVDINYSCRGSTALRCAARVGNPEYVKLLIEKGAQLDEYRYGYTVLHVAAAKGHAECIKILIDKGYDLKLGGRDYRSPLESILQLENIECIKILIESKHLSIDDETLLRCAVKLGNINCVKYLIESQCNENSQQALLHFAAQAQNTDMIKLLLDAKVDPNIPNEIGQTALYSVIENMGQDIIMKSLWGPNKIWSITLQHRVELLNKPCENIKIMLANGAKLDIVDKNGNTPLHRVVFQYNNSDDIDSSHTFGVKTAPELLRKKGDHIKGYIDKQNKDGDTALHIAARQGKSNLVKWLCNAGADVNIRNKQGRTPLDIAINLCDTTQEIKNLSIIEQLMHSTTPEIIARASRKIADPTLQSMIKHHMTKSEKGTKSKKSARAVGDGPGPIKQKKEEVKKEEVKKEEVKKEEVKKEEVKKEEVKKEEVKKEVKEEVKEEVEETLCNSRSDNRDAGGDILTSWRAVELLQEENSSLNERDAITSNYNDIFGDGLSNMCVPKVFEDLGACQSTVLYNSNIVQLTLSGGGAKE